MASPREVVAPPRSAADIGTLASSLISCVQTRRWVILWLLARRGLDMLLGKNDGTCRADRTERSRADSGRCRSEGSSQFLLSKAAWPGLPQWVRHPHARRSAKAPLTSALLIYS